MYEMQYVEVQSGTYDQNVQINAEWTRGNLYNFAFT